MKSTDDSSKSFNIDLIFDKYNLYLLNFNSLLKTKGLVTYCKTYCRTIHSKYKNANVQKNGSVAYVQ
jgi:hypothetical protein